MIQFEDENGHTEYWYDTQELAKALSLKDDNGKYVGRNRMFKLLRLNKILDKHNQPHVYYMNLGIGKTHTTSKRYKRYNMPIWSERAIGYFKMRFETGKYIIHFEKNVKKESYVMKLDDVC